VNIAHYEMNIESPSSASIAHEYCTGFMYPSQCLSQREQHANWNPSNPT